MCFRGGAGCPGAEQEGCRCHLAVKLRKSAERSANSLHARDVSFGPIPSSLGLKLRLLEEEDSLSLQRGSRSVSRTAQAAEKDPKHSGRPALPDPGLQFVCPRAQSEFWDSRRGIAEEPRVPVNDTIQHQAMPSFQF